MAVGNLTAIVGFSVVSLPSLYFETYNNLCTLAVNGESFEYGIGPNTLIINTLSGKKLYLNNSGLTCMWGFMEFNIILEDKTNVKFSTKRTVQIIIDDQVEDDKMVVSDDLLFNLKDSSRHRLNNYLIFDIIHIVLINNTINNSFVPSKATRVSLSLYQSESHFEEDLLDEALHKYFAYPKYLCKGDVFSIQIDENKLWTFMDVAKVDTIYFKVCEIEDNTKKENSSGLIQGFLVDSSVTVYQVSNHQGFYPPRRVPLPYKLCTQALLNDGVLMPYTHCPVPQWFDEPFKTLVRWFEPFFCRIQDIPLKPVFLLSGPNGSGKSFLLHALSQLFGVFYWRVDCVTISGQIPSQAEAKLKAVFAQLKNQAPCILHLSSIQALYQDLNMKDDVRAICCFEEELKNMNLEWPVIIVGTTCNVKSITSSIHNLFLDSISLGPPNSNHQRKSIISWLLKFNSCFIDDEIMDSVASQTSGFMFRDLQVIVALAFKQKYKRSKDLNVEDDPDKFILEDFSKTIELMHKAYSESIGAPKVPHVSWQDVGGLEPLKKEIIQSLRSNMLNSGLRRSGLLLHGPPGTGKTLLAKAVATECGRNFLSVKGPELLNMYVGQSEQNVRDLFELAKASSPCIVFFDELDSLAPNRGRNGDSGGVMDRVVSQLLSEMDELTYTGDVFMLGATNRPDLIDPALLRPGRLDKLLYVGPCEDRNSQLSVLTALTRKLRLEPDVDLEAVVSRLPTSVSGAQLSALCSAAWMTSARRAIKSGAANKPEPKIVVNQDHFLAAIGDIFRLSM